MVTDCYRLPKTSVAQRVSTVDLRLLVVLPSARENPFFSGLIIDLGNNGCLSKSNLGFGNFPNPKSLPFGPAKISPNPNPKFWVPFWKTSNDDDDDADDDDDDEEADMVGN